jgi:hypothetical protein
MTLGVAHGLADEAAQVAPEAHPAGRQVGRRRARDLDQPRAALVASHRDEECPGDLLRAAACDRLAPGGIERTAVGRLPQPAQAIRPVQEPDARLPADQVGDMRVEPSCDLVRIERRQERAREREKRVLTGGGRHRPVIGRKAA